MPVSSSEASVEEDDVAPSSNRCGSPDWDQCFAAVDQISEHFKFTNEHDVVRDKFRFLSRSSCEVIRHYESVIFLWI